jgi:hypothetical protein
VVLLIVAYLIFGTSTTYEVRVQAGDVRQVPPEQVGEALADAAEQKARRIAQQEAGPVMSPTYGREFEEIAANPFRPDLGDMLPFLPGQRLIRATVTDIQAASLERLAAAMPVPATPRVRTRWMVPDRGGDAGGRRGRRRPMGGVMAQAPQLEEYGVAVMASEYDMKKLREQWTEALKDTPLQTITIIYDQQNELQVRQADGSWKTVETYSTVRADAEAAVPEVRTIPEGRGRFDWEGPRMGGFDGRRGPRSEMLPEIPDFTGENGAEVWQAVTARAAWRQYLLNPNYYYYFYFPTLNWVPWQTHLPRTESIDEWYTLLRRQRVMQGQQGMGGRPGAVPAEDEPLQPPMYVPDVDGQLQDNIPYPTVELVERPEEVRPEREEPNRRRPPRRREEEYPDDFMPPPDVFEDYEPDRRRRRPVRPRPDRDEPQLPVRRRQLPPAPEHVTLVPSPEWQQQTGRVVYWAFYDKMEAGKVYRIRTRLRMINPVLAKPRDVDDPAEAQQKLVATPWSDWSQSFSLPDSAMFFVTGSARAGGILQITVYRRKFDQWLAQPFEIVPGMEIGRISDHPILNPLTGMVETRKIDFTTDTLAVTIDFDHVVPLTATGVAREQTQALAYLTPDGHLRNRLRSQDDTDPDHVRLDKQADLQKDRVKTTLQMGQAPGRQAGR